VRDEVWSLRDVDLDVAEGEAVGLLGRNGAGKSTMLKVLTRITDPTSGTVRTRGRVGALLEVGTGFHPELTGRENVYLNGAVLGMARSEIDRQYDAIVDFSGVERFLDTPVKRYSSGMYCGWPSRSPRTCRPTSWWWTRSSPSATPSSSASASARWLTSSGPAAPSSSSATTSTPSSGCARGRCGWSRGGWR
jgi:hypothetical protein